MRASDILQTGQPRAAKRDRVANSEIADGIDRLEHITREKTFLNVADVGRIAEIAQIVADRGERASRKLAEDLRRIEREHRFTPAARLQFQNLLGKLGIDSDFEIRIPRDDRPYWLRKEHRLTAYRSNRDLPLSSDVVVVGAGLTGASAAYHLSKAATQPSKIVVLDQGAPGSEASGRNGGNFELLPENSVGIYEGLARERQAFLHRRYPAVPKEIVRIESERQASIIFGVALRNRDLMKRIIEQENIECDFSPRGWLFLAHTKDDAPLGSSWRDVAVQAGQPWKKLFRGVERFRECQYANARPGSVALYAA